MGRGNTVHVILILLIRTRLLLTYFIIYKIVIQTLWGTESNLIKIHSTGISIFAQMTVLSILTNIHFLEQILCLSNMTFPGVTQNRIGRDCIL